MSLFNFNYSIGKNSKIDSNVKIGYRTGRKIKFVKTMIGDNARIRSNTVIYTNIKIGDRLETGHGVIIREENEIGEGFNIWNNSCVDYGCKIGNNVKIHNNVYIAQFTIIEDDVFMAPGVIIANDPCPICTECMKGPTIKNGARIGINATILPRVIIGESALVGAGCVVTKDVAPETVVVGNPSRVLGSIYDIKCHAGIVDRPYLNKLDVYRRKLKK